MKAGLYAKFSCEIKLPLGSCEQPVKMRLGKSLGRIGLG